MWAPKQISDLCTLKLYSSFNISQFVAHITSTAAVVVLPAILLSQVELRNRELAFAFSTLGFGLISITASVISYILLVRITKNPLDSIARHATLFAAAGDQNAIFLAACLSGMRISRNPRELGHEGSASTVDIKGLVIKVERRWSVRVEIVERWGYGWRDPWEEMESRQASRQALQMETYPELE